MAKAIKVTLRGVERRRISSMKENNKPHHLDKDQWDYTWYFPHYPIGSMEVAERIVDRLGNKQNNNATESCVGSQTIGRWLGWRATVRRRYYPISDIWWGRYSNSWTTVTTLPMDCWGGWMLIYPIVAGQANGLIDNTKCILKSFATYGRPKYKSLHQFHQLLIERSTKLSPVLTASRSTWSLVVRVYIGHWLDVGASLLIVRNSLIDWGIPLIYWAYLWKDHARSNKTQSTWLVQKASHRRAGRVATINDWAPRKDVLRSHDAHSCLLA